MNEKAYRSAEGISRSELWKLRESPEKFKWHRENPQPPSSALIFGRAVHKLLLEPETFDDEFAIMPKFDKRTKDGKIAEESFREVLSDRDIITNVDYKIASEMAEKARKNPFVQELLVGEYEKPLFWKDDLTGELCKVRLDILTNYNGELTVVDYKTTTNAETHKFNRSIYNYGYHFQAGMYCEAVKQTLKTGEFPNFVFIAQEKTPPYPINIIAVPEDVILHGYDVFRELIGIYHECKETGYWYGYNGAFNLPNEAYLLGWVKHEADFEE